MALVMKMKAMLLVGSNNTEDGGDADETIVPDEPILPSIGYWPLTLKISVKVKLFSTAETKTETKSVFQIQKTEISIPFIHSATSIRRFML